MRILDSRRNTGESYHTETDSQDDLSLDRSENPGDMFSSDAAHKE